MMMKLGKIWGCMWPVSGRSLQYLNHSFPLASRRLFSGMLTPFDDDLSAADDEMFGLEDFKHYQESPEVEKARLLHDQELLGPDSGAFSLPELVGARVPSIFVSKLNDPYINLAIEQYIYSHLPIDGKNGAEVYPRLLFYTNSPCVVIGKNQNPWKEVNLPLLNLLHLPLLRRNSGGGTVVHDWGNVNFSYMTSKKNFDRFTFAQIVSSAVNLLGKTQLTVNERGDVVTAEDGLKVSGSAYKISRGKSYHHGTMLLSLRLDVLGQLLAKNESKRGVVDALASVASVPSKVTNVGLENEEFIAVVGQHFEPNSSPLKTVINKETELPSEVIEEAKRLKSWDWQYGATPKFTHILTHETGVVVKFEVGKQAVVEKVHVDAEPETKEKFEYLVEAAEKGQLQYTGSNVAGFVLDDCLSEWLGESIDGTS